MTRRKRDPVPAPAPYRVGWIADPRVRRYGRVAGLVLVCGLAGVLGIRALAAAVRHQVQGLPRYQVAVRDIEITPPPAWIRSDIVGEVARAEGLPRRLSILEPGLARRLYDAFRIHPWVRRAERVELLSPARIRVRLVYRQPVAAVLTDVDLVPIDAEGVVCPRWDFDLDDLHRYWIIRGLPLENQEVTPGVALPGPVVAAAAATAQFLAADRTRLGLSVIDVRDDRGGIRGTLRLTTGTADGPEVIWGKPAGSIDPSEVRAATKLERLRAEVQDNGPFDQQDGRRGWDIDVTRLDRAVRVVRRPRSRAGALFPAVLGR